MNQIFGLVLNHYVLVHINDILVYSKNSQDHITHLIYVVETLRQHYLYAKFEKCSFLIHQISFLGHMVSDEGVFIDSTVIENIISLDRPVNTKDVQRFLGQVGYYWRFI